MNDLDRKFVRFAARYLQNIPVSPEFIRHRNEHAAKFKDKKPRTPEEKLMDSDCLLPEFILLQNNVVDRPVHLSHDFRLDGHLVDVKVINAESFTIDEDQRAWFRHGISQNQLTDFAFFSFKDKRTRPLEAGDTVSFKYKSAARAQHVLNNIKTSQFTNAPPYYKVVTVQPAYDSV